MLLGVSIFYSVSFIVNLVDKGSFTLGSGIILINLIVLSVSFVFYKKLFNLKNIKRSIYFFFIWNALILIASGSVNGHISNSKSSTKKNKSTEQTAPKDSLVKIEKDSAGSTNIKIGSSSDENDSNISIMIFFFSVAIMVFRLSRNEIIQLNVIFFLPPSLFDIFILGNNYLSNYLPTSIMVVGFMFITLIVENRRRKKYYNEYDIAYKKNYDTLRMKKELEYAQQLQLSMLPERYAVVNDLEISAISIPATEVGGDYYDYFKLSDEKIGIFICDVSGHGVASALLLSGIRSCMHLILEETDDPKVIFTKLNRVIRKTQSRKMFVTAIFAVIDKKTNKCTLYNAGHLPPYKISGESNEIYKLKKHGLTLGAADNIYADESKEIVIDFKKRDKLILYTDGVNEAQNEKRDEYGIDKIEEFLNSNSDKKTNQIIDDLVADVNKFTQNKIQSDDLTIIAVERIN